MCGRQVLRADETLLKKTFPDFDFTDLGLTPRYNIPPSTGVLSLVGGSNRAEFLRWGLIPSWARDTAIGFKTINARAETADSLPSFRGAFKSKRAILFADGFIEWMPALPGQKLKRPVLFEMPDRRPFAMAGLWESWTSPLTGEVIRSCTLITCPPNATVGAVHDRMPVLLRPDQIGLWLGSGKDLTLSRSLMQPYEGELTATTVSTAVNSVKNQEPEVLARAG